MLIAYATKNGSTQEVADAIGEVVRAEGREVDLRPAGEVDDVTGYEAVVLGAPIYMGRWHKDAVRFLKRHSAELKGKPLAVFALGPVTTEEKDWRLAREQLDRALAKVRDVEPAAVEMFGGAVDPAKLRFPFSHMPEADVRDWKAIREWALALPGLLDAREREPAAV